MITSAINLAVEFGNPETEPMDVSLADGASARAAQRAWAKVPVPDRLRWLRRLRGLIAEHARRLAEASAQARRRPVAEALTAEVLPLADACRFLEREAERLLAPRRLGVKHRPLWLAGIRTEIHREAMGLILVIGPTNYPLFLPGVQVIQALVAGNAVLLKPGLGGTAAASALLDLMRAAGLDPRLVTLLTESVQTVHAALALRPDKVVLTGSAETGEKLLGRLGPHLIPSTMELSGSDSVLVRADADLDLVTKALVFGLRLNGGATCMAPKRVFVHASVATELEGRLAQALQTEVSPEPDPAVSALLRDLVEEALCAGAHYIAGTPRSDGAPRFPVVLGGVAPHVRLMDASVFAPFLAVVTVADDAGAMEAANASAYALGASIFTANREIAHRLAKCISAGIVTINDVIIPSADPRIPFGGRGRSGFGVTRGAEGLLELTVPKVITLTRGNLRPAFEPASGADESLFESYVLAAHGRGWVRRIKGLFSVTKNLLHRTTRV